MNKLLWSQDEYLRAYNFAALAHRGQLVPGTDLPYVTYKFGEHGDNGRTERGARDNGNFAQQYV